MFHDLWGNPSIPDGLSLNFCFASMSKMNVIAGEGETGAKATYMTRCSVMILTVRFTCDSPHHHQTPASAKFDEVL
jgi:hypothetical protein